jgi:hypothetical protein
MSRSYDHKFDQGKLRYDLLPWDCVEQVVDILTYGAKKYEAEDWKIVDDASNRYFSALLRHLIAYKQGEDTDQESGKLHLAHVATNALFLLWFNMQKNNQTTIKNYREYYSINNQAVACASCGISLSNKPGAIFPYIKPMILFCSTKCREEYNAKSTNNSS